MSLLRRLFRCPRGLHTPASEGYCSFATKHDLPRNYFRCEDCGQLFTSRGATHEDIVPLRKVLDQIPQEHYDTINRVGLIGLQPPGPWPAAPGAVQTGGPLPPLGANPDLSDSKTVEVLEGMLPKEPCSHLGHSPAFNGRKDDPSVSSLMAQVNLVFAKLRNKQAEHEVRGRFKDHVYGAIAETIAMLGTCCRLKVGCVLLTKEGRVAGLGYNGAGPGMDHCHEDHCNETCRCLRTLHAEQNALYSRNGDPAVAYVTNEPCLNCTKELALAGVRRVVYLKPYTSIAADERTARQEWIDHYHIAWEALNDPSSSA